MLAQVFVFFLVAIGALVALTLTLLESWTARLVLWGIVAGLYYRFGMIPAMIAAAILSIGVFLKAKMPSISKI